MARKDESEADDTLSSFSKADRMVIVSVSAYWVTSISLVLLNKVMFSSADVGIKGAPIFLTWTQIVVAVLCCILVHFIKPSVRALDFFPRFEYDLNIALRIAPLTAIFLAMIVFNNLCLKYVEVSFYQVARSLSIIFNIIFSFVLLGKTTSQKAMASCGIIVVGYWLGVDGEVKYSKEGVTYGILSSVFVSLYSIYVSKVLKHVGEDHWRLLIYNNVNALWMMPPVFWYLGEWEVVLLSENTGTNLFWGMICVVGLFGFMINISTFMQIKYTSPLSHNVSGTCKACVQTLIGLWIWQNPTTPLGLFGTFLSIFGCGVYGYVKYLDGQAAQNKGYDRLPTTTKEAADMEMDRMDKK